MTIPRRLCSPQNVVCCARNHVAAAAVAFAPTRAANAPSACATPRYQTWRKRFCGRRSASEPHSSRTPSMNAQPATSATSASSGVPSAIVFAKSWASAALARIASSQSCSAISWTWRCSPERKPWHRLISKKPSAGEGHDVLFSQDLDNPGWVAHMPHPGDYDYDGPPSTQYSPIPATVALDEAASRLSALLRSMLPAALSSKAATLVRVGGRSS
jgi:hypothetical protein